VPPVDTAACAVHPGTPAALACARCGLFACTACRSTNIDDECAACEHRSPDATLPAAAWWGARRRYYNRGLLVAGPLAYVLYVLSLALHPDAELSLFALPFQALGYLLMMGVANLCYGLGPLVEWWVAQQHVGRYRRAAYGAGYAFSVALPFLLPLLSVAFALLPRR
jgi:hypothetical protein